MRICSGPQHTARSIANWLELRLASVCSYSLYMFRAQSARRCQQHMLVMTLWSGCDTGKSSGHSRQSDSSSCRQRCCSIQPRPRSRRLTWPQGAHCCFGAEVSRDSLHGCLQGVCFGHMPAAAWYQTLYAVQWCVGLPCCRWRNA